MQTSSFPTIELYTTPTCPDCRQLKLWFDQLGITYQEHDLSRTEVADEAKARTGVRVAPITVIGTKIYYGTHDAQRTQLRQDWPELFGAGR